MLWTSLLVLFSSCLSDVSHDNPLDPNSHASGFTLSGNVKTLYAPFQPISNAVVSLMPANTKVFSGTDGAFSIQSVMPGSYTVYCSAQGHSRDSLNILVTDNQNIKFFLDGLPYFENIALTTHHVSRFFPVEDLFYLQIDAGVGDPDGIADIKRVTFEIPDFSVGDTLTTSRNAGSFSRRLSLENLPVSSIHSLIGRAFVLSVTDDPGQSSQSGKRFLTRVIDLTPAVSRPTNSQTINSDSIAFSWEKVRLPYWFDQKIEVFQINLGLLIKVAEFGSIPASAISKSIKNSLPNGDYVWIFSVDDEFGNSSSAKESTFHINR